jgi:hypothetical protein
MQDLLISTACEPFGYVRIDLFSQVLPRFDAAAHKPASISMTHFNYLSGLILNYLSPDRCEAASAASPSGVTSRPVQPWGGTSDPCGRPIRWWHGANGRTAAGEGRVHVHGVTCRAPREQFVNVAKRRSGF